MRFYCTHLSFRVGFQNTGTLICNVCDSFEEARSEFHELFGDAVSVDDNRRESVFVNLEVVKITK